MFAELGIFSFTFLFFIVPHNPDGHGAFIKNQGYF